MTAAFSVLFLTFYRRSSNDSRFNYLVIEVPCARFNKYLILNTVLILFCMTRINYIVRQRFIFRKTVVTFWNALSSQILLYFSFSEVITLFWDFEKWNRFLRRHFIAPIDSIFYEARKSVICKKSDQLFTHLEWADGACLKRTCLPLKIERRLWTIEIRTVVRTAARSDFHIFNVPKSCFQL